MSSSGNDTVSIRVTYDKAYRWKYIVAFFSLNNLLYFYRSILSLSDTSKAQRGTCPLHFQPVCRHPLPVVKRGVQKQSCFFTKDNFSDYIIIIWHLTCLLLKLSFVSSTGNPNCMKSLGRLCELHAWIARENNPITTTSSFSAEKSSMKAQNFYSQSLRREYKKITDHGRR